MNPQIKEKILILKTAFKAYHALDELIGEYAIGSAEYAELMKAQAKIEQVVVQIAQDIAALYESDD